MMQPSRKRPSTDANRSARSARLHAAPSPDAPVRSAPWLSFNAVALPSPVSDSAPAFGPNRFLLGANLPWIRYGFDVGASPVTPAGGLHADPAAAEALDVALARLKQDGAEHARVFLLCDGRAGIRFALDGTPEGLDDAVFPDIDLLLGAAERHRVALILVLFDAGLVAAASEQEAVSCGGRRDLLADPTKRQALLERVVEPLLRRYGDHPAVEAWDLFDEPECATVGMHCPHPPCARGASRWRQRLAAFGRMMRSLGGGAPADAGPALVEPEAMRSFLGSAVLAVHAHTRALATVGLASTVNLDLVAGLGLDFYQAHWWEPYGDAALRRAVADLRLDRPLVLGAFPSATRSKSVKTVLDTARCAGYGGALLWSMRAVDERGGQEGQLGQWARNHAEHLYRRPLRAEAPVPLAAAPIAPAAESRPAEDGDDEEPVVRSELENGVPALAASPA
jgi:hypothetical protein